MRVFSLACFAALSVSALAACKAVVTSASGSPDAGAGASGGSGPAPCPAEGCDPPVPTACTPGESISCYDGPAGTLGVGRCRSGLAACAADGSGYGICVGQVQPRAEICGTTSDDDCDGVTLPCTEVPAWFLAFEGSTQTSQPLRVTFDRDGDLLVAAYFPDPSIHDFALIKVDPWGTELARLSLGSFDLRFAAAPDGGLVVASSNNNGFSGELRIRRYDAAWQPVFDRTFSAGPAWPSAIDVDAEGNTVLAGAFTGFVKFGEISIGPAYGNTPDTFVASFDPAGNVRWAKRVIEGATGEPQGIQTVSMDALGNAVLVGAGSPNAVVDFGAGPVSVAAGGFADVLLAKLDPAGAPLWVKRFNGNPMTDNIRGRLDTQGHVYIVGNTGYGLDFGGGPLGSQGGFAAVFDPAGNYVRSFDVNSSSGWINDFAIDAAGNIVLAAAMHGGMGTYDYQAHLSRWSPDGELLTSRDFGDADVQEAGGLVLDAAGNPSFVGYSCGTIDVGTGPHPNTSTDTSCNVFLARTLMP
ncbi:hypothetical protein [Polyangium sorediatum]|uniref:Cell surface protein n=1 Tax=Polyangium sorediatum TaxID=889274 RepID=A0ABT6P4N7_9BACT|nr:hypothetical protein [Polyangium sorediatum]MDI1435518.1 hypothetical protein [Polyangium sorediatum]